MKRYILVILSLAAAASLFEACRKDAEPVPADPTAYEIEVPPFFPPMDIPADNPTTQEGVELGRMLFYEKRLSADNTQACAGCHLPEASFSDPNQFSVGIDGIAGTRQSMAIVNLGWNNEFFWDGRSETLEIQALEPVPNPIEMHQTWPAAVNKLLADDEYRRMFFAAFETTGIDSSHVSMALSQFMRTMISGNSKYDQVLRGEALFTANELEGFNIYSTERGDCFHCHGGILFSNQIYSNNGLDSVFTDLGRYDVTGDVNDEGKFKTPTLRNIEYSGPYMHDGRFTTLDEVLNHYSEHVVWSPTIDPNMKKVADGGLQLTQAEKDDLKAFLLTLSDPAFLTNPAFQNPRP